MCREWNTFVEEKVTAAGNAKAVSASVKDAEVIALNDVKTEHEERIYSKIGELDRVRWEARRSVPGSVIYSCGRRSGNWKVYTSSAGLSEAGRGT